jgi:dual specificity MAP kinase phosphatase
VLTIDDFDVFEKKYPELVAVDSCGRTTDNKIEFLIQEREEMRRLTTASKMADNIYLGNTSDAFNSCVEYINPKGKLATKGFDVIIECKDGAEVPSASVIKDAESFMNGGAMLDIPFSRLGPWFGTTLSRPLALVFPSSTPPNSINRLNPDSIVSFCEWIHRIARTPNIPEDSEDIPMTDTQDISSANSRNILFHCQDGYTETTFLALTYLIYSEGITAHEAWVRLHADLQRSFFAFESDLKAITLLQPYLLARSPTATSFHRMSSPPPIPQWFTNPQFDGSFPSRILPHMYLGNLQHANNPAMLRTLGITRVLSIGEKVIWDMEKEADAGMHLMFLDNVQDNGIDPLLDYIDPCLEFLGTYSI